MLTVQNDWIEYETEPVPARRVAVRGGAACAQRVPVVSTRAAAPAARPAARPAAIAAPARPAADRPAAAVARRRLRLTRRGRVVLVVLPSLLALSGLLLAAAPGTAEAAQPAAARTVVVGTGDTLWSIAERVAPGADPRDVVAELEHANGVSGADLQAGQVLVLPAER